MMSNTSYAVLTKARSKYGRFLSDRDYASLLSCESVPEVMLYLKSHTRFASVLSEINERDVHRGLLEILLRQYQFSEFVSLCRYDSGMGTGFSLFIIEKYEVEQIIRYLILLNSHSTETFIFQYPAFLSKHTELDFNRIANARDYGEFLSALERTDYYDVLKVFRPDDKGRLPVSEIENKLYTRLFLHMLEFINKKTKGDERRELTEILRKMNDYRMVSRIIRMKQYYDLPPEVLKASTNPEYSALSEKVISRMCEAESAEEIYQILHTTRYGRMMEKVGADKQIDNVGPVIEYRLAKRYLHFSSNPSVVLVSFIYLSETELMNVICLIEGVRYRVDPKIIQSLLIR